MSGSGIQKNIYTISYAPVTTTLGMWGKDTTIHASNTSNDGKFRIYKTRTENNYINRVKSFSLAEGESIILYVMGVYNAISFVIGNKVKISLINDKLEYEIIESKAHKIAATITKSFEDFTIIDKAINYATATTDWSAILTKS